MEGGGAAREFNGKLWDWIDSRCNELPKRCTPFLLTDANGHVGKPFRDSDWQGESEDSGVGPKGREGENVNGMLVRQFMEKQHMAAFNTFMDSGSGPTCYKTGVGEGKSTT